MTATGERREQGFLLAELLVALGLLAIALLAMTPLFVIAGRQNAAAGDLTFAATMAQEKAESLKSTPYTSLAAGSDVVAQRRASYDRAWTVAADSPHPGMKTVTVTVTPRRTESGSLGAKRTVTVVYYRVP
jgi:type II secretory pathway pseudopilin PulG